MELIVFEDDLVRNFYPLTYTKPSFLLLNGMKTFLSSIKEFFAPDHFSLIIREYLKPLVSKYTKGEPEFDGSVIFSNSLLLTDMLKLPKEDEFIVSSKGRVAVAKLKGKKARRFAKKIKPDRSLAKVYEIPGLILEYPWELILFEERLKSQLPSIGSNISDCKVLGDSSKLTIKNSEIEPYCVFDVRSGPIMVDGARIESGTRITGPAYIGKGARLMGAKVKSSIIMEEVRLGGEVDTSIIEGYTNSAHRSYIGHSYISSWVNIGAGSVTSDLKNTYGAIKMWINGSRVDTGMLKLGSFIGEGVKISIGTMIYCGKKVGPFSQLHGHVLEDVPSFTLYAKSLGYDSFELYLDSAIRTQERMMKRRGLNMDESYRKMVKYLFDLTKEERAKVRKGKFNI